MELTLDMETRSRVSLKDCGLYVYAEGESTDIMCIAVKVDSQIPWIWVPNKFRSLGKSEISDQQLMELVKNADKIHAHNSSFERILWTEILVKRYGFHEIDFNKWRCTAAKAAAFSLPRALKYACEALDLNQKKDTLGYRIMMKMCKPNKKGEWQEDKKDFAILCRYCCQDVEAEYDLNHTVPDLPESELVIWQLDQRINDLGIKVDTDAIDNLIYKVQAREKQILMEVQELTGGAINSTRQGDKLKVWLDSVGVAIDDLTKASVTALLETDLAPEVKRVMEIRQSLAKSSVKKLEAMKRRACKDGRIRGTLLYHGGHTGRWAGQGIQPQNFPRESYESNDIRDILRAGVDELERKYGCTFQQASKCLRGMLMAAEGKILLTADLSAIEARVLAWVACEAEVLQAARDGLDLYKVAATAVFKNKYEEVTDKQRFVGKTIVLACGYQGWVNAFRRIGVTQPNAAELIEAMSDKEIAGYIGEWRETRVSTTRFWKGVLEAAVKCVKSKEPYAYGMVKFGIRGRFLHCRLPSGRLLSYCDPEVEIYTDQWHREHEIITYMGVNPLNKRWERLSTYGGKLTENIVQAIARDVLADAMANLDMLGYKIVMHIHDEIVIEADEGNIEEVIEVMSFTPSWAPGLPVSADGWVGERYKKA